MARLSTFRADAIPLRMMRMVAKTPTRGGSRNRSEINFATGDERPATAADMAMNSSASAAGGRSKLDINRSCTCPAPSSRTAMPRRSFRPSGSCIPDALDSRRVARISAPGWKQSCRRSTGTSALTNSSAFLTLSADFA